jgi:hypothetical protein
VGVRFEGDIDVLIWRFDQRIKLIRAGFEPLPGSLLSKHGELTGCLHPCGVNRPMERLKTGAAKPSPKNWNKRAEFFALPVSSFGKLSCND